ncbi:MAG TPA: PAS domain S-box protein, partial [Anaerolineales bacterium]|nr:PAS domain S-box protein [Anaerolineales bacterium]
MNRIPSSMPSALFTEDGDTLPTHWLYLLLGLFTGITLFLTLPLAFKVPTGGWIIGLQGGMGIVICLLLAFLVRAFQATLRRAQESEQKYRNLLENIPAITYLNGLGDDSPTTYVSPQIKDLIGFSREALLADPHLWFKCVHPDDQARVQAENERTNHTGAPFLLDYRLKTQTGETVWIHDAAVLVRNENGDPLHWLGVWTDITSRKQSETALAQERDLLQALMDNIPDMIYFKDTASRFIRINRAHANLLGLKDPAQAIGKTDFDLHVPELAQDFYREEQILFRTGRPILDRLEYNPSDSTPRWISATKVPLRGPDGQLIGLVGISRDVTEWEVTRRMLEKQATELATVTRVSSAISTILDVSEL